jgi:Tol biopolymer transport system component
MPLPRGEKLGPYEIVALLGIGGMGEVYRARDPRLNREVALKISGARFSERFEREARVIAALNHQNICTLHDVGPSYLVMELVEGPTLSDRIARRPLGLDEALDIAWQITDALAAAHGKGVVHRDLKPANIKLTADDRVKVLDFGLARTQSGCAASPDSPTVTVDATQAGAILGTAPYMSPEQARGHTVDERADIWAFGVVLYEMLTGRRPFPGETSTDVLTSVVKDEPNLDTVPLRVRRLLRACLQKDPRRRLQHIGDARLLLEDDRDTASRGHPLLWLVGIATMVAIAALWLPWRASAPAQPLVRFQIPAPLDVQRPAGMFSLSPDGRLLAFATQASGSPARIWVRPLESLEARPLPGSERPGGQPPFFWSPDSRYIVFDGGGKLKKIDVSGGAPVQTLCDLPGMALGGSWSGDVILIGSASGGLMRIPPDGGPPVPVTALDPGRKELLHAFPVFLSDRRHFLYLNATEDPNNAGTLIGSLDIPPDQQPRRRLLPGPLSATWIPGQVLFLREGVLYAQGFDESRLELVGASARIAASVGVYFGFPYFSVSRNAVLVYRPAATEDLQLTWFDRQGKPTGTAGPPGLYNHVSVAPDGSRVIVSRQDAQTSVKWDLWLWDSKRGANRRLTFDAGRPDHPVLSPDQSLIAYSSLARGSAAITIRRFDGSSQEEITGGPGSTWRPTCWSHDGRFLLFTSTSALGSDVWLLPHSPTAQPVRIIGGPFNKGDAQFSPDLRWIAYTSDESGRAEIYVRPFWRESPAELPHEKSIMISTNGGAEPRWRADGRELIYVAPDRKLMAVEMKPGDRFDAGFPKVVFQHPPGASYGDMSADAQHFLFELPSSSAEQPPFNVVLNWPATLGRR